MRGLQPSSLLFLPPIYALLCVKLGHAEEKFIQLLLSLVSLIACFINVIREEDKSCSCCLYLFLVLIMIRLYFM